MVTFGEMTDLMAFLYVIFSCVFFHFSEWCLGLGVVFDPKGASLFVIIVVSERFQQTKQTDNACCDWLFNAQNWVNCLEV